MPQPRIEPIEVLLFSVAVVAICAAAGLARYYRRKGAPRANGRHWWRGERVAVAPGIRAGWASFVFLNLIFGLVQPLIACGLFMRAYVLRAMFLRRGRRAM